MCVIIRKPADVRIDSKILQNCYDNNVDGWGIMFADDATKTVKKVKSLGNFKAFMKEYEAVEHLPLGIHFRWKTHGELSADMCHPFPILSKTKDGGFVDNRLMMMHNGIISMGKSDPVKSDTVLFIEERIEPVIKKFGRGLISEPAFQQLIKEAIGGSNKLLFLTGEGKFVTINEPVGEMIEGAWYSNAYSTKPSWRSTTASYKSRYTPAQPAATQPYYGAGYGGSSYTPAGAGGKPAVGETGKFDWEEELDDNVGRNDKLPANKSVTVIDKSNDKTLKDVIKGVLKSAPGGYTVTAERTKNVPVAIANNNTNFLRKADFTPQHIIDNDSWFNTSTQSWYAERLENDNLEIKEKDFETMTREDILEWVQMYPVQLAEFLFKKFSWDAQEDVDLDDGGSDMGDDDDQEAELDRALGKA